MQLPSKQTNNKLRINVRKHRELQRRRQRQPQRRHPSGKYTCIRFRETHAGNTPSISTSQERQRYGCRQEIPWCRNPPPQHQTCLALLRTRRGVCRLQGTPQDDALLESCRHASLLFQRTTQTQSPTSSKCRATSHRRRRPTRVTCRVF